MTRSEHEHLVERYLSGRMSPADEQEFFIQVAVDSNLRQTLKAYRVVETAMQKHRDSFPTQHLASRAKLISRLEGARAGESAMETGGRALAGSGAARIGFRWSLAAVAAAALTVGALVIGPMIDRGAPDPGAGEQPAISAPRMARPGTASPGTSAPSGNGATVAPPEARIAAPATTPATTPTTMAPTTTAAATIERREPAAPSRTEEHAVPRERRHAPIEEIGGRSAARHATSPAAVETPSGESTSVSQTSTEPQEWVSRKSGRTAKTRYTSQDTIKIPVQINLPKTPK